MRDDVVQLDSMDKEASTSERTTAAQKVIASSVGGLIVALTTCPFDVVTRRLQAQKGRDGLKFRNSLVC